MNENGNPENLRPFEVGNLASVKHGVFSERAVAPRAQEIAEGLLRLPQADGMDWVAAHEIGMLVARIEACDRDLDERGHFGKRGARSLLDYRSRLSGQLLRYPREFGATPRSRFEYVEALVRPTVAELLARKREGRET